MVRKNIGLIVVVFILILGGFIYLSGTDFSKLNLLAAASNLFWPTDQKETETVRLLNEAKSELARLQEEIFFEKEKLKTEKELRAELELKYRSDIAILAGELEDLTGMVDSFNLKMAQLAIDLGPELESEKKSCSVNLNTASKEDLQKLVGIGPVLSQRIIGARPFSSVGDLIRVGGIGGTTLEKIIKQGCAYIDEADKEEEDEEEVAEESEEKAPADVVCPMDINIASKEELQAIIGIGPVLAQRIIEARPYSSVYDLIRVSGIGEATLEKIITQGCAYASGYTGSGGGSGTSSAPPPPSSAKPRSEISLVYPEENPVNKEIEVILSASNLINTTYDVKISIEKEGVLSQIYNQEKEGEDKWQSSAYYLTKAFSNTFFEGSFRLKIREDKEDFRGEADIIVRIKETGKTGFSEFKGIINITDREEKPVIEYNLTIDIVGGGTTDPVIGTHIYEKNEQVAVTAFPDEGWKFIGWDGSMVLEEITTTVVMDEDKTITAIFEEEQDESEPPINLLLNEFFEEWEEDDKQAKYWEGDGWLKSSDHALIGNYSAKTVKTGENTFRQRNLKEVVADQSYYAEVRVRGSGKIRVGIIYPSNYHYYCPEVLLNNDDWTEIVCERLIPSTSQGESGGIVIKISTLESEAVYIGAAWLGITSPPDSWLDKN